MGRRIVKMSSDLLTQMLTQDWEIGRGEIIRCIKGLPEGARLEEADVVDLVFSHPDWPDDLAIYEIRHQIIQRLRLFDGQEEWGHGHDEKS